MSCIHAYVVHVKEYLLACILLIGVMTVVVLTVVVRVLMVLMVMVLMALISGCLVNVNNHIITSCASTLSRIHIAVISNSVMET